MTPAILLALVTAQYSQDELARMFMRELEPYREIHAVDGVANLPNGRAVRVLGICDSQKASAPWGANGLPLSKDQAAGFERAAGFSLGKRPWPTTTPLGEMEGRLAVFEVSAATPDGTFAFLDLPAGTSPLSEAISLGKTRHLAARWFTAHVGIPKKMRTSNWSVLLLGPKQPIGTFREENPAPINGFHVTIKAKRPEPLLVYVNGRRVSSPLVEYTITLEAPAALEEQSLSVETREPTELRPNGIDLAREFVRYAKSTKPGYRLFVFRVQGLEQEGFHRKFSFYARPMARVQFRNLPMVAEG